MNKIIKESDPRFNKLKDIFNYKISDLVVTGHIYYYYIPKELLIKEFHNSFSRVVFNPTEEWDNWVSGFSIENFLKEACNLTKQEYYDLLFLKINDISERPVCACCGTPKNFFRLSSGYKTKPGQMNYFCDTSCEMSYYSQNSDIQIRANYSAFLSLDDPWTSAVFYLAKVNDGYKFGVSSSEYYRSSFIGWLYGVEVEDFKVLKRGSRYQMANLESRIKLDLKSHFEFFDDSLLEKFMELFNKNVELMNFSPYPDIAEKYHSTKIKVNITRFGMPDKFNAFRSINYQVVPHDGVNLRDFSVEEICNLSKNSYIISASEEDIAFANKLPLEVQRRIMLPQTKDGIVDYKYYVPKDAPFYDKVKDYGIIYPEYRKFNIDEEKEFCKYVKELGDKFVVKVTESSGSRGVYVINSEKEPEPGAREQYKVMTQEMIEECFDWARKTNSGVIVQRLSYSYAPNMTFFGINMIIRNGRLVVSKWEIADETASTNFNHGTQLRNEFTDDVTNRFVKLFVEGCGITDGILGIDCCTDYKSVVTLNEVNFRMENCVFSFETMGIDAIDAYLFPDNYSMDMVPYGEHPFIRYWRAMYFNREEMKGKLL